MEITAEFKGSQQIFRTTIAGVTKQNSDGTDRQKLVKLLKRGETLSLVREPNNPYDKYAIAVFRTSGEQLGYLHAGDRRLADHIDMGGQVSAQVVRTGGGVGILGYVFKSFRKPYGCVIEIKKGNYNWKEVSPYMEESRKIEELIKAAYSMEENDPTKSISMYREAIEQIIRFDSGGPIKAAWRRARYPVNRLSLVLEKRDEIRAAQGEIFKYERFHDVYGLTTTEKKSVEARKERLGRKLADADHGVTPM